MNEKTSKQYVTGYIAIFAALLVLSVFLFVGNSASVIVYGIRGVFFNEIMITICFGLAASVVLVFFACLSFCKFSAKLAALVEKAVTILAALLVAVLLIIEASRYHVYYDSTPFNYPIAQIAISMVVQLFVLAVYFIADRRLDDCDARLPERSVLTGIFFDFAIVMVLFVASLGYISISSYYSEVYYRWSDIVAIFFCVAAVVMAVYMAVKVRAAKSSRAMPLIGIISALLLLFFAIMTWVDDTYLYGFSYGICDTDQIVLCVIYIAVVLAYAVARGLRARSGEQNGRAYGAKCAISFVSSLLLLVMLCIPLCHYSYYASYYCLGLGAMFSVEGSDYVMGYEWAKVIVGILCWLIFIVAVVLIIFNIKSMFSPSNSTRRLVERLTVIAALPISFLYMLIGIVISIISGAPTYAYISLIFGVALLVAYFMLEKRYPYPEEEKKSTEAEGNVSGYVSPAIHIVCLLFVPFWQYVWIYRATDYLNCVQGEERREPINKLLLCLFVPFYSIYWVYKSAQRIDKLAEEHGISSGLSTVCAVLAIFVPIIPSIIMQLKINEISTAKGKGEKSQHTDDVTESINVAYSLKQYKELLDMGAITQEEYDAKKAELLNRN